MKLTHTLTTAAACMAGALALAGCGGAPDNSGGSGKKAANLKLTATTPAANGPAGTVKWLLEDEPDSLDLDTQGTSAGRVILSNVCERLYQLRPDMSVRPHLAAKESRPDDRTLVLTLRDDVTFHDGAKMTADDVLFSLKRHAADGMEQSDEFEHVKSMKATGEHEITVRFSRPDAMFAKALAGDAGIIYQRKAVEKAGKEFGTPGRPDACTGPYALQSWKSGDSVAIARYDDYWGKKPLTGKVVFTWAADSAMVNALKTGAADGAYTEAPNTAAALDSAKGVDLHFGPSTAVLTLMPTERGGLADPKIRRALSLALDRTGIAKSGYGGLVEPWNLPAGSGAWGYEKAAFAAAQKSTGHAPAKPGAKDLARAKELVKEAGVPKDPILIGTDSTQGRTVMANAVRAALEQIGLRGEIKTVPPSEFETFYGDKAKRAEVDLFVGDWYISKSDPVGVLDNALSGSENNWTGFKDKAYDAAVNKALATIDDAERARLTVKAQRLFTDASVWIPVAQIPSTLILSGKLTGAPASMAYLYYPWAADLGAKKG
ncbi:ABC transporter substrate-binding protein [Streptomyces sp. A7024]|uniref:ABC transporter substrate-binding protein n=1 Tax=Streptomyces coryli TaxID=1128680 RepID=A0A6G4U116_9ACTN|nr:ABC transporter substrate-binding protein [Streptomyces coryli]NGN65844.1 ABC transporter substrate-binding protein [Streptomyces coryli]